MFNLKPQPPVSSTNQAAHTTAPAQPLPPNKVQEKIIGKYKVQVIREKCISAGSCVAIAPKIFALDEEGLAYVLSQNGEDDDTKLLAAQSCPTQAIIVTDITTGKQVWPV